MVVALLVAHALLRSLSHTKLLRHVGCEACLPGRHSQRELGGESLTTPTKPLKAAENAAAPRQDRTKTSHCFHEKPKTLPNGLLWHETSWAVGRRTKVFSSPLRGGTWLQVAQAPAELSHRQASGFVRPVPLQLSAA